jgi:aspartate ammonia-lyase
MDKTGKKTRLEKDPLGTRAVPKDALYGIQTLRAMENFPISGARPRPVLIRSIAMVKKASAIANMGLGSIDRRRGRAIIKATDVIIRGGLLDQFVVDAYNSGAGTSFNMNANEVIANRAIETLGGKKGDYSIVHPNDHVNMSQSSNDCVPTAIRVAALVSAGPLLAALSGLKSSLGKKAVEFRGILKSGRTHLQDAVPITLGAEFSSYSSSINSSISGIREACNRLNRLGLGGTAVGTGILTHPLYAEKAIKALREISGLKGLKKAPNAFESIGSADDFLAFSGSLRGASVELLRVANDLRLLSSGPFTGIGEIMLPPAQPGSSIMPGKVNPSIAEMLCMVAYQVIGNDQAVLMASQAGSLELNVMTPVIGQNILQSAELLTNSINAFNQRCVIGIKADKKRCYENFKKSTGLATALNPLIGYEKASAVAKAAVRTGTTIKDSAIERGVITEKEWDLIERRGVFIRPTKTGLKRR